MSTYSYKNPKFINSPKGMVEVVEVIYYFMLSST